MSDKTPASRQLLNITKALLDDANAENERLQALCDPDYDRAFLVAYRAHIIEECAREIETWTDVQIASSGSSGVAAAIRALKDGDKT